MTPLRAAIVQVCIDLGALRESDRLRPWRIDRTYAGPAQRSAGAWSWALYCPDSGYRCNTIGSHAPAREVVRAHKDRRVCLLSGTHWAPGISLIVELKPCR